MSNKNIKQNYLLQIKNILKKVEKSKDAASHFRCIILMGDTQEKDAYSFIHASQEDMKNLILSAIRYNPDFIKADGDAFMQYYKEHCEKGEKVSQPKTDKNEENPIRED